jgi:MinD superfamily P-loop ATPase
MRVTIASGKGGTGKTTVAVSLAAAAAGRGVDTVYADCDVEEPNGAIFLRPEITRVSHVDVAVPKIDPEKCSACGLCGGICRFSALVLLGKKPLFFPELCHSCGGCALVCPAGAITETKRLVGKVSSGHSGRIKFIQGLLNVREAMATPVIRAVKRSAPKAEFVINDAPPGASCPMIESARGSDYILLVTEPTPFGLNDLKIAFETVKKLGVPAGMVINRAGGGGIQAVRDHCKDAGAEILAEIPEERRAAEAYSRGEMIFSAVPGMRERFTELLDKVLQKLKKKEAAALS